MGILDRVRCISPPFKPPDDQYYSDRWPQYSLRGGWLRARPGQGTGPAPSATRVAPSTRVLSYLTLKLFGHLAIGLNLELGKKP